MMNPPTTGFIIKWLTLNGLNKRNINKPIQKPRQVEQDTNFPMKGQFLFKNPLIELNIISLDMILVKPQQANM